MKTESDLIRVASVDDHDLMRGGIRFVLMAFDDMQFVGDAKRGEDAVVLCKEQNPDVLLVDMRMHGIDGIETTVSVKEACPEVQVLVLSSFHDADLVRRALHAGAIGYVLKDADKEELANAIRSANAGRVTIASQIAKDLVDESRQPVDLTERERQVLTLLVKGMSNKEIAKQMHRSPYTIRHHVSQLIKRLGASNRAEVAAIAVQRELI